MVTSPNDAVIAETRDGICRITFNRAKALSANNLDMADALHHIAAEIRTDDTIRVVVMSGAGDHFMAGSDIKAFKAFLDEKPDEATIRAHFEEMLGIVHDFIADFRDMPQPVIGAVPPKLLCGSNPFCILLLVGERSAAASAQLSTALPLDSSADRLAKITRVLARFESRALFE